MCELSSDLGFSELRAPREISLIPKTFGCHPPGTLPSVDLLMATDGLTEEMMVTVLDR